jgi:hypothetical protein
MAGLNLFTNNAATTLASAINSSVTSLTVASGTGTLFPTLAGSQYFFCTLANNAGTTEIVKVTARSTDTFTIVRGQDGTSAVSWSSGDKVELRLTRIDLLNFPQLDSTNTFAAAQTFSDAISYGTTLTGGTGIINLGSGQFYKDATGNVGIGTTSPSSKLTVGANPPVAGALAAVGATGGISLATSDNVNSSLYIRNAAGGSIIGTDASNALRFATSGNTATEERLRIGSSGEIGIGGANYGTSGQVLTSGGSGAAVSWSTISGGQIQTQLFATPGPATWTNPGTVTQVRVTVIGGGGGGALSPPAVVTGGAGGVIQTMVTIPTSPVAITVGAGGAGKAFPGVANGNAGGTSSFGSFASATGGGAGVIPASAGTPGTGSSPAPVTPGNIKSSDVKSLNYTNIGLITSSGSLRAALSPNVNVPAIDYAITGSNAIYMAGLPGPGGAGPGGSVGGVGGVVVVEFVG